MIALSIQENKREQMRSKDFIRQADKRTISRRLSLSVPLFALFALVSRRLLLTFRDGRGTREERVRGVERETNVPEFLERDDD